MAGSFYHNIWDEILNRFLRIEIKLINFLLSQYEWLIEDTVI